MTAIDITLIFLLIAQQLFYMLQVQKLIDKLMSRNYFEFKQAEMPVTQREPRMDNTPVEDLGSMMEFGA